MTATARTYTAQAATDRWYRVNLYQGITAVSSPKFAPSTDGFSQLSGSYNLDEAHATRGMVLLDQSGSYWEGAVGLDNDGIAWFISSDASLGAKVNVDAGLRWFPMSTWRFSQIKKGMDGNAYLYGHQLPESSQIPGSSVVAQMPTTGAPEGLSTVGMVAIGLGMLGLGVGLARRRSIWLMCP